ncbi:hypothetical protein LCGC14_1801230 [marine sediment metagenome]|uniref:Uncharacterized protein n=1 Tax=marine sediment metagenome TaxID=412755 RepID=A0A0F9JPA5_9ZZZZ
MALGHIDFDRAGPADKPSPSIWKDCPHQDLNDLGQGIFNHVNFDGPPTGVLAAALDVTMISFGGRLALSADTDTVLGTVSADRGGVLQVDTDADDNDAAALFSQPFGNIVRNSGNKLWFEAYVATGDVDADLGLFIGLVEEDAVDGTTTNALDVLLDGVAANAVVAESLIGFIQDNGDDNAFDIIYKKDAGTAVNPFTDVTNATAIASGDRASLTDDTLFKLGIKFNGIAKLEFYVNGIKIGTQDVDDTIDQAKDYCVVINMKTGTTAAEHFRLGWVRWAHQERR